MTSRPTFISGDRIYLRPLSSSDVGQKYLSWMNDSEVNFALESRFRPLGMDQLESFVRSTNARSDVLFLAIVAKEGDVHIGNVKLGPIDWIHRLGDIGIIIGDKAYWGKGYATEAIIALSRHAFDVMNLHKLTAGCYATNEGSKRAFMKAGFEHEGTRRSHYFTPNGYVDGIVMGMVNPREAA